MDYKEELRHILENLKQERDELHVRMHLSKADLQDEMQKLERKWEELRYRGQQALEAVDESSREASETLKTTADDLKDGYRKIRESLNRVKP